MASDFQGLRHCAICAHWRRLRQGALVGRCDINATIGFTSEWHDCPGFETRSQTRPGIPAGFGRDVRALPRRKGS